jgi:hypothetical protein
LTRGSRVCRYAERTFCNARRITGDIPEREAAGCRLLVA